MEDLQGSRESLKSASSYLKMGVVALAYLGVRAIFGADIHESMYKLFNSQQPVNLLQGTDIGAVTISGIGLACSVPDAIHGAYRNIMSKRRLKQLETREREGLEAVSS